MRCGVVVVSLAGACACTSGGEIEGSSGTTTASEDGSATASVSSTSATASGPGTSSSDASTSESGATASESDSTASETGTTATTESSTGGLLACAVVDVDGVCDDVSACPEGSTPFAAICDDVPSVQCCVPASPPCSVDGAPGLCLDVRACAAPLLATAGLCPGAANVQCCTDPDTACDPSAMPTPNEGLVEESWDAACPDGMVRSDGFCIDRYEAALVELDAAGDVVGSWSPYFNPGDARVRAVSVRAAVPQGYITQQQATAACAEAGKRLCDDEEWLRACGGASATTYPYGDDVEPGACNDARAMHPAIEYFGTADAWIWSELDHPCISQIPASLDLTGQNAGCVAEDGAFDLVGNLHEWTSDPAGTFRGGFYVDTQLNGPGCTYATTAHDVTHFDYSTGFRCCAD